MNTQEEFQIARVTLYEYLIYSALLIQVLKFLNLQDLGIVDSANTNVKWRPQYLIRLSQMNHSIFHSIQPKEALTKWVIKRCIAVEEMVFKKEENEPHDNWFTIDDSETISVMNMALLKKITLSVSEDNKSFANITDSFLISISKCCGKLESVNLTNCKWITYVGVMALVDKCLELEELNVGCLGGGIYPEINNYNITDTCLAAIGKKSHKLKSVDLSGFMSIRNINELSKWCPLLQNINLSRCYRITDKSVIELSKECSLLKTIKLNCCRNITDSSVIELSKGCPLLQHIDLKYCNNITDACVIEISKRCPLLHNINLMGCKNITNTSVIELSKGCPLLHTINLSYHITYDGHKSLALNCPYLKGPEYDQFR